MLGGSNGDNTLRESIEEVIEEHDGARRSSTDEERHMLVNILGFGQLRVDDVMVPRADVVAVEENATLDERFAPLSRYRRIRACRVFAKRWMTRSAPIAKT